MGRLVNIGAAAGAVFLAGQAFAQSSPEVEQPAPMPWSSSCSSAGRSEPLDCTMQQRVVVTQTGQLLVALTIRVSQAGTQPRLVAQVPFGLELSDGLKILLAEAAIGHLPFRTCNDGGCYAEAAVSDEMIAQLSANKTVDVAIRDVAGREIKIPVSLSGFADAFARIR